jgi:NADH-dependent peroxiredoxin subunit F
MNQIAPMDQSLYDTIVIGGGPAGVAAVVYAARKKLYSLLLTEGFGGQSKVSRSIENWIGETAISGADLAEKLQKHVEAQADVKVKTAARVTEVTKGSDCIFEVKTETGETYRSKSVIVTSGGRRRRLNVDGEDRLDGKGVAFCSTCDAPLFGGATVAVVGSGNSAMEGAVDLLPYAKKIYMLTRSDKLRGDPVNQEKIRSSKSVEIIPNTQVQAVLGDRGVTGLQYKDTKTGEVKTLDVQGVFVEIGMTPNSDFIKKIIKTNDSGEIMVEHLTGQTSEKGILAAGDVTNDPFKQNNIAAGDGVRAALSAYDYVLNIKKYSPCAENDL